MKPAHRAIIIILALLLSACGLNLGDAGLVARSALRRETSPSVSPADAQALLAGNTTFAFDFFQQVREPQRNLIFSPYSLSLGSAMLYAGAGGDTASQVAETLHFTLPPEQLHPALNALSLELSKREAQSKKIDASRPMQLDLANA